MKIISPKRNLTNKELEIYLSLDYKKQKKYLESLHQELFQEINYDRKR